MKARFEKPYHYAMWSKGTTPLAGKSALNRAERGRAEPGRHRRIAHDPAAIKALFVDVFRDAHRAPPPARSCWSWTRPAFPRDR